MRSAFAAVLLTALASISVRADQQAPREVPGQGRLPLGTVLMFSARPSGAPLIPFICDGSAHLAYELYLTNFSAKRARIATLDIRGVGGAAFAATLAGEALKASFVAVGTGNRVAPTDPVLAPGESGVIFVFLNFARARPPQRLANSLAVEIDGEPKTAQTVTPAALTISSRATAVIDSPLAGDHWQAANGPSNTSIHRRAVIVLNGSARIPERYAIDWVRLGDDGNTFSGDEHQNSSYHAWNLPVTAAADGRIVRAEDGIPENVPHSDKLAIGMTVDNLPGNNVVEEIGPGLFVGYAHFRPGTVAVKPGDKVHCGQLLGRLGNSGNSTEPHLHLQLCDAPSFLACDGVPMAFRQMKLARYRIDKHGQTPVRLVTEATRDAPGEEPLEDALADFPAAGDSAQHGGRARDGRSTEAQLTPGQIRRASGRA